MAEGRRTDTGQAEQVGGLSVVTTATDGVRVLALAGEIDHHTGGQLSRALGRFFRIIGSLVWVCR
ncbi:hypothetical protein [Streptomyces albogriseolus]|uniref:hypothetical protein n=1 Tax=Streptomyces albogriseolus TaxID=1887 RepID=UPI00369EC576